MQSDLRVRSPLSPRHAAPRIVLCALAAAAALAGTTRAAPTASPPKLGFDDSRPAVFLILRVGTIVRLGPIRYDEFGRVSGFDEEIVSDGTKTTLKIEVDPALDRSQAASYRYTAEVDGKATKSPSLAEWETTEAKGYLGFAAAELGGVLLRSLGPLEIDATSRFAYDDFGRRMLAEQEFGHQGVKYRITYSDYDFDKFGRLAGYTAEVKHVE